jgi:hypothetical protein
MQLLDCLNIWMKQFEQYQVGMDVMYLDFAKAFDFVSLQKLLIKLDA